MHIFRTNSSIWTLFLLGEILSRLIIALIVIVISKKQARKTPRSLISSVKFAHVDLSFSKFVTMIFEKNIRKLRSHGTIRVYICKVFEARVTQQLPPVRRFHASRNGAPDDTGRRVEDYRVFVKRFATASFPWRNAKCIPLLCKPRLPACSRHERATIAPW